MRTILFLLGLVLGILISGSNNGEASQLFTLKEIHRDGSERYLRKSDVADLNSTLRIIVERTNLRTSISQYAPSLELTNMIAQMEVLRKAAIEGQKAIPKMNQALNDWAQSNKDQNAIKLLAVQLDAAAGDALIILSNAERGTDFRNALNLALRKTRGRPAIEQLMVIFEEAEKESARIKNAVDEVLKKDGIYVLIGAWINTANGNRPIHLENYDDYPIGDRFEVTRFNFALNDAQKKQIDSYAGIARDINEKGLDDILKANMSSVGNTGQEQIKTFTASLTPCFEKLNEKLKVMKKETDSAFKVVASKSEAMIASTQSYLDYINTLAAKYGENQSSTMTSEKLLININADSIDLYERTLVLLTSYHDLIKEADKMPSQARLLVKKARDEVKTAGNDCMDGLQAKVEMFKNLQVIVATLLSGKQVGKDMTEFGQNTLKHDISNLPDDPEFSLLDTGAREPGDTVIVKIATGSASQAKRERERHDVTLLQTTGSVNTAVSLIFARNDHKFQAAPSYSWLYKFASNKLAYKQLVDMGVGLNVSALDFNHDDTPELGVALTVSAFRDYIQVGYGYNIQANKGFAFFGLSLPLPTK